MSARPRPVTATVNPPLTSTPLHGPRTFLSSDGSTESLISVLDHDSYRSLSPSDTECETPVSSPEKPRQKTECKITRKTSSKTTSSVSTSKTSKTPDHGRTSSTPGSQNGRLTPWEDWMVQKAKAMRIQQEEELARIGIIKREKERLTKEKAEKQKKCDKTIKEWNERKVVELRTRKKMDNQCLNAEKELKEAKQLEIEQKSKVKFEEWQKQKKNEEKERKKREKAKKEVEEREKAERQQKCQEKYEAWLTDAKKRPKSAPHSYGYAEGKLTGYYDHAAYPTPAFFNPIPWQPIPVPNQGIAKKPKPHKKNVRKRFNPNKYL